MFSDAARNWHFGVLSFTGTGHLNPFIALSLELKRRGHRVTFIEKPKIQERVLEAGLEFFPISGKKPSTQRTPPNHSSSPWSELSALRFNLNRVICDVEMFLKEIPAVVAKTGVNALLVNELAWTGPTVAQLLGLPYFIISTSVPYSLGWGTSTRFSRYLPSSNIVSWLSRSLLELSALRMRGPVLWALNGWRSRAGLGPACEIQRIHPHLAHITQLPAWLDLPQTKLPGNFYYAGPFESSDSRPHVPFPWDELDGRPVIYATLGTTRNVQPVVFRLIAEACSDLNLQLVISLGNRFEPMLLDGLSGRPVVTRYAPQLQLLKIAQAVITHGGSNTVLETLAEGKPMIVIPNVYDQPAMAARLERLHVARILPLKRLDARGLRSALEAVLDDPNYGAAAMRIQTRMQASSGRARAADIIEEALDRYLDHARLTSHAERFQLNNDSRLPCIETASKLSS